MSLLIYLSLLQSQMTLFLANRLINQVYPNCFRVAQTSSEIMLGSIGKFLWDNTLLWIDIRLIGAACIVLTDLWQNHIRPRSSTTIPYKIQKKLDDNEKTIDVITMIPRAIIGFVAMTTIFALMFPLGFTIPVAAIRVMKNIYQKKLLVLAVKP
jgi:hypothetical protein